MSALARCLLVVGVISMAFVTGWAAEEWQCTMTLIGSQEQADRTPCDFRQSSCGTWLAQCCARGSYEGIELRVKAGRIGRDGASWFGGSLDTEQEPGVALIASLFPAAVWVQLSEVQRTFDCRLSSDCMPTTPAPLSRWIDYGSSKSGKSHYSRGWSLYGWQATGSPMSLALDNGILFLFQQDAAAVDVTFTLYIWHTGFEPWLSCSSSVWEVKLHCWAEG